MEPSVAAVFLRQAAICRSPAAFLTLATTRGPAIGWVVTGSTSILSQMPWIFFFEAFEFVPQFENLKKFLET